MSGSVLPSGLRAALIASLGLTLAACTDHGEDTSSVTPEPQPPSLSDDVEINDWAFDSGDATLVSAAQVSGLYATASVNDGHIEIRDINQNLEHSLDASFITNIIQGISLPSEGMVCAMTLTPSGRFLYFAVCGEGQGEDKDAILAYNTNTEQLSLLDRLTLSEQDGGRFGMTYFSGQLYTGSDFGVYRQDASRNVAYTEETTFDRELITVNGPVTGLAVDMPDKTIYLSTSEQLFRMSPDGSAITQIASGNSFAGLTMGRVFGNQETGAGLYLLDNSTDYSQLLRVPLEELQNEGQVQPELYQQLDRVVHAVSATADGKMMLADGAGSLLRDTTDTRLSYKGWLNDELDQYLVGIKSLVIDDSIPGTNDNSINNGALIPGMITSRLQAAENEYLPTAPNGALPGWAVFPLMAIDQIRNDPDIELLIELIIKAHLGLSDGYGGERSVDGHFIKSHTRDGEPGKSPDPQVYVSMKLLPAIYRAAELYPDNENIQLYKEYARQLFKRSSDTIRAERRVTWHVDDFGPILNNNGMNSEAWIYGDLGAAQDPLATQDYYLHTYNRTEMKYDDWLAGEPVIEASHAAFIIMGGTLILRHHYYNDDWREQNVNYYAASMAATDDEGYPYFAAFSAGNQPDCQEPNQADCLYDANYFNDGPSSNPNSIIHFPAVLGLGQHQFTAPMVGGYMAYRDGRRQAMWNIAGGDDIQMLTRLSMAVPDYVMEHVGLADFWFGAIGLVETIAPGTTDRLRYDYFRSELIVDSKAEGTELTYSAFTPRRVIAHNSDGSTTSYGYQLSPFTIPAGQSHTNYEVIDPEGELLELEDLVNQQHNKPMRFTNPSFENELYGWDTTGTVTTAPGLVGNSALISGAGALSQPLELEMDLDNTRYIIRANARASNPGTGKGYMRLTWRATDNKNDQILGTSTSNEVDSTVPEAELIANTNKPTGANYLHIEYVVEGDGSFTFDNTSVVRLGADSPLPDGDLSQGLGNSWELFGNVQLVDESQGHPFGAGNALLFSRDQHQTNWQRAIYTLDISNDPLGTRYIFRFDANAEGAQDIKFEAKVDVMDEHGNRIIERRDVDDVPPGFVGESVFTMRKRPGDHRYDITFRMMKNQEAETGLAELYMTNFRLDKERLFREENCVDDSPSGCLPSIHQ